MGSCHHRKLGICVSVVVLGTFICGTILAYTAFASPSTKRDTLQQVAFLFRHGARNPTETYAKDPYINYDWPNGWGALTKKGMLQLYNLGQWIRLKYDVVIDDKFKSATTTVRSSYADRCIMSAQALLARLFVPSPDDMFLPGLPWIPVPVHSIPRDVDKLITVKAPCPRLAEALKQAYREEAERSDEEMADYYKKLTKYTGQTMSTITDVEFLYNTLEIEEEEGLLLPTWTHEFYNERMREIAARSLALFTDNIIQKRLNGGPLLKEILKNMEDSGTNPAEKGSYFYSAHDITIVNVLRTMGFTNELFKPDYGAMIIFELHLINNGADREMKALYLNNTEMENAHPLDIPNCTSPCLLPNLKHLWHEVIPVNWDAECEM